MDDMGGGGGGGSAVMGIVMALGGLIVGIGVWVFFAYCLKRIVEKMGGEPGVLIWIPVLALIPLLNAVGWELWKIVLFFIPIVSLIFGILLWVEILKKLNKNPVMVLLLFVPCVNIFFIPWLAFGS